MRGCLCYARRKHKKDHVVNSSSPIRDSDVDDSKDIVWCDSRLAFESDTDDDFKSVNGDSLPSSFGSNQGTPHPTFATLKERMEELARENGGHDTPSPPQSGRTSPEEKKTLGQLFVSNPEEDAKPGIENKVFAPARQGSKKGSNQYNA